MRIALSVLCVLLMIGFPSTAARGQGKGLIISSNGYHLVTESTGGLELEKIQYVFDLTGGTDPPTPPDPGLDLKDKVRNWTEEINEPSIAANLGRSYRVMAGLVDSELITTKQSLVDQQQRVNQVIFAESSNAAAWREWESKLADELERLQSSGKLNTLADLAKAWREIGEAIESADSTAQILPPEVCTIARIILNVVCSQ